MLTPARNQIVYAVYPACKVILYDYYRAMRVIRLSEKTIFCRSLTGGEHKFWRESSREVGSRASLRMTQPLTMKTAEIDAGHSW